MTEPQGGSEDLEDPADNPLITGGIGGRRPFAVRPPESQWYKQLVMIGALAIMALADAYIFWNTLVSKIQRDTAWLLVLVLALSVGAISLCHEAGRIARERSRTQLRGIGWVAVLILLWLSMGLVIAYIRSHTPLDANSVGDGTINTLDPSSTATSATSDASTSFTISNPAVQLTLLMLVLYLSTGALAIGHGYRFSDPRTRKRRALVRTGNDLDKQMDRIREERERAQHGYIVSLENAERMNQIQNGQGELAEALAVELRAISRLHTARIQGDPVATDQLFPPAGRNGAAPTESGADPYTDDVGEDPYADDAGDDIEE